MTKKDDALSLLELIPNPNSEDVIKIATKVGCSERTVYRALEGLRLTLNCQSDTIVSKKKQTSIPPQNTAQEAPTFIDDPNELLMSCAKRELNKLNPEVRWATILVNILKETKQLETVSKERSEAQSKLKQYSTIDLINLRKKLTGNLLEDG